MLTSSRWSRISLFTLLLGVPVAAACTNGLVEIDPQPLGDAGVLADGAITTTPTPTTTATATGEPAPTPAPSPADASANADGATPQGTTLPIPSFDAGPGWCGDGPALSETTLDVAFGGGWRGPGAPQQLCTQADVDALKALFKASTSVKFEDVKTALGATCASCAFRPASGTTWGPFVESSGGGTYANYASCFALATNTPCARDLAYYQACLDTSCEDAVCGSSQATRTCMKTAGTSQCQTFATALKQSCGSKLDEIDRQCGNIFQVISATCGGGLDAAVP